MITRVCDREECGRSSAESRVQPQDVALFPARNAKPDRDGERPARAERARCRMTLALRWGLMFSLFNDSVKWRTSNGSLLCPLKPSRRNSSDGDDVAGIGTERRASTGHRLCIWDKRPSAAPPVGKGRRERAAIWPGLRFIHHVRHRWTATLANPRKLHTHSLSWPHSPDDDRANPHRQGMDHECSSSYARPARRSP